MITKCMQAWYKTHSGKDTEQNKTKQKHLHGLRLIVVVRYTTTVVQVGVVFVGIIAAGSGRVVILVFPVLVAVLQECLDHAVFVGL